MSTNKKQFIQNLVSQFWDSEPCDSENSLLSTDSLDYFIEIERDRYFYQRHILDVLDWVDFNSKNVLEIGTGVGTDARQLIARGAIYNGINIDGGSCNITNKALKVFNLNGFVCQMDATDIKFDSGYFDIVYSFGVLHHIPDVQAAICEIHNVIKPGGYFLFMVYNKSSINYLVEIRYLRRWFLSLIKLPACIKILALLGFSTEKLLRHVELFEKYGKMDDTEWLSRNTDGPDNPYSVVYDSDGINYLLGNKFSLIKSEIYFFDWRHWGVFGNLLPRCVTNFLGKKWGWHRVILARKNLE